VCDRIEDPTKTDSPSAKYESRASESAEAELRDHEPAEAASKLFFRAEGPSVSWLLLAIPYVANIDLCAFAVLDRIVSFLEQARV